MWMWILVNDHSTMLRWIWITMCSKWICAAYASVCIICLFFRHRFVYFEIRMPFFFYFGFLLYYILFNNFCGLARLFSFTKGYISMKKNHRSRWPDIQIQKRKKNAKKITITKTNQFPSVLKYAQSI